MKRQQLVSLTIVLTALAVILIQMMTEPKQEVAVTPKPAASSIEIPSVSEVAETSQPEADTGVVSNLELPTNAVVAQPSAPAQLSTPVEEKIQENFKNARQTFQQKDAIAKAKAQDVHRMPKPMLDAAQRLGEIAELEAQHPEQAENFRDFYLECARDGKTITVIRAQCLNRYVKVAKLDAMDQKQLLGEFTEDVIRLFEALQ